MLRKQIRYPLICIKCRIIDVLKAALAPIPLRLVVQIAPIVHSLHILHILAPLLLVHHLVALLVILLSTLISLISILTPPVIVQVLPETLILHLVIVRLKTALLMIALVKITRISSLALKVLLSR